MSREKSFEQPYLYILIFNNPYSKSNPRLSKKFLKTITTAKAEERFKNCFKHNTSDALISKALEDLQILSAGKDKITVEELVQKIFELTLEIMQKNLGIEIKSAVVNDNKEIMLSLKVSDKNLRVQAELIRYKLKLKHSDINEPFKKYPPYGEFTKEGHKKKLYDEVNESVFKYSDRVRLLYSMITSVIELSELESLTLLSSQFALHTHELESFSDRWVDLRNFLKPQDIDAVNNYFGEKIAMYFA